MNSVLQERIDELETDGLSDREIADNTSKLKLKMRLLK